MTTPDKIISTILNGILITACLAGVYFVMIYTIHFNVEIYSSVISVAYVALSMQYAWKSYEQ